ncbi:hypothetical protein [Hamadaea tsunoensis]|uniref:hypothetical protein n=1 Tax=Hamadaea tsunoensis TaxID=53368 RepID=UPI00041955CB|nr:hypothetical protein [Hamadaea tsunoensis]
MDLWHELTPQQYAVMVNAVEEACLNQVIYEFHARRFWRANGGVTSVAPPPMTEEELRSLIPQFAEVVADLIARGWIEIREPWMPWDDSPTMTAQEIAQTLGDPDTWICDEQGGRRMVGLMTTVRWDSLVANR